MTDIHRIDHSIVVTVTDLDGLAAVYETLGFTVTPISHHLANSRPGEPKVRMGTANRCVVFAENYVELLGLVNPDGDDQWGVRRLASAHEGLRGQILGCVDAEAVDRRLTAAGMTTSGVLALQRDVETPDGVATLRARVIRFDLDGVPEGGLGIGEIEDRSINHQPAFMTHPNGAVGLSAITLVVADGELEHYLRRYRTLLDVDDRADGPRRVFDLPVGQVEIVPLSAMGTLLPGTSAPVLPYVAAQKISVTDLDAARSLIQRNGIATHPLPDAFLVRAEDTLGANIIFREP